MRPYFFKELLRKYRNKETSAEETNLVDKWYDSFGEEFPKIHRHQKNFIQRDIQAKLVTQLFEQKQRRVRFLQPLFIGAAATILIAIGVSIWFFYQQKITPDEQQIVKTIEISTELGKLKKVQLPDSSTVWLNSGSKLSFSTPFGQSGIREVTLVEGEAYFDIARDVNRRFIVRTGALKIGVLGTSFNIKSYKQLDNIQLSVLSGVVEIFQEDSVKLAVLERGKELSYRKSDHHFSIQNQVAEESKAWLSGNTHLRQASFDELALALQHSFDIKLTAGNRKVSIQRYTLQLSRDIPIDELIEVISKVHNNKFRKEGNVITIF